MSDYPDPDEEFELTYGDELDLLREQEEDIYQPPSKSRKSLDFSPTTHTVKTKFTTNNSQSQSLESFENDFPKLTSITSEIVESQPTHEPSATLDFQSVSSILSQSDIAASSNSRKRTIEELFGDINDLGDDILEDLPCAKKYKSTEAEELQALMEHIVQLRKLNKEKHSIVGVRTHISTHNNERDRYNVSYRVPKYPFIGVKRHDGERVYVRFHSEEYEKEEIQRIVSDCSSKGLMGDSYKKVWEEASDLINKQITSMSNEADHDEISVIEESDRKQLWTELYKPRKYIDLLSDESTNRIMLKWLKLWDKAVFNRKPKIHPIKPDEHKSKFNSQKELNRNLDEHGRPQHKVALLCGPPGLGKTTLAHVAAKHAGYNVVEVNASDDRSTEAFKKSLENATQMRSVVDAEGRPNCLVFDEIDGAPQASIDFLVKFINGTTTAKPKKGKNQKQFILKRPIICICNDVYVPALRPLRQIAFVINFPQTSSARLAERLMCIARRENMKTDLGAMLALAEKSNKDIRSCLSFLYFFKIQSKPVTLSDVCKASIGQKDIQKGLFSVWQEIFQIEKSKHKLSSNSKTSDTKQILQIRMSNILQTVSSFGDYDRLSQGVFENFTKLKLKDSSMNGISEASKWFVFSDLLNKQIYSLQNYTLTSYLPYAFVVWHYIFATPQSQMLHYPSAGYEAKQKETRQKALISEVLRGMKPCTRAYCHRLSLILDILPLLSRIIVPTFRPVSLHLYTKEEKLNMSRVVNVMIDYNLNYIQERLPEGHYEYTLEPNIDEMVIFDKTNPFPRKALSYSNKQLIAREIELEKLRQFEGAKDVKESTNKKKELNTNKTELPNHLQTLKAKTVNAAKPIIRKDFFGREVKSSTPSSGKIGPNLKNDIWYQYKEGYNNAVRKKIRISSLK